MIGVNMQSETSQLQGYERMLELNEIPLADRNQIVRGAELFLERGWPNHHFTLGMASRAGLGLVPPIYDGPGSEERYFQALQESVQAPVEISVRCKKSVQPERLPCLSAMAS